MLNQAFLNLFFRICLFSPRSTEKMALSAWRKLIHDFLPNLRVKISAGFLLEGSETSLAHARFFPNLQVNHQGLKALRSTEADIRSERQHSLRTLGEESQADGVDWGVALSPAVFIVRTVGHFLRRLFFESSGNGLVVAQAFHDLRVDKGLQFRGNWHTSFGLLPEGIGEFDHLRSPTRLVNKIPLDPAI